MPSLVDEYFSRQSQLRGDVLEIGVRRWEKDRPTTWRDRVNALGCVHTGTDAMDGDDVDIACDAHELSKHFAAGRFSGFICRATLEHFRRPWVVAAELATVCRAGAVGFVETHQSYPVHGYPHDYFRFTTEALRELFAADVGWRVLRAEYQYPAKVIPVCNDVQAGGWNFVAEAWLNVSALVERLP